MDKTIEIIFTSKLHLCNVKAAIKISYLCYFFWQKQYQTPKCIKKTVNHV